MASAHGMPRRLDDPWQRRLSDILTAVLSAWSSASTPVTLARVELDFGMLTRDDWQEELLERLPALLREVLGAPPTEDAPHDPATSDGTRRASETAPNDVLAQLVARLALGADPWWASDLAPCATDLLVQRALAHDAPRFLSWLAADGQQIHVQQRLQAQLSAATRQTLVDQAAGAALWDTGVSLRVEPWPHSSAPAAQAVHGPIAQMSLGWLLWALPDDHAWLSAIIRGVDARQRDVHTWLRALCRQLVTRFDSETRRTRRLRTAFRSLRPPGALRAAWFAAHGDDREPERDEADTIARQNTALLARLRSGLPGAGPAIDAAKTAANAFAATSSLWAETLFMELLRAGDRADSTSPSSQAAALPKPLLVRTLLRTAVDTKTLPAFARARHRVAAHDPPEWAHAEPALEALRWWVTFRRSPPFSHGESMVTLARSALRAGVSRKQVLDQLSLWSRKSSQYAGFGRSELAPWVQLPRRELLALLEVAIGVVRAAQWRKRLYATERAQRGHRRRAEVVSYVRALALQWLLADSTRNADSLPSLKDWNVWLTQLGFAACAEEHVQSASNRARVNAQVATNMRSERAKESAFAQHTNTLAGALVHDEGTLRDSLLHGQAAHSAPSSHSSATLDPRSDPAASAMHTPSLSFDAHSVGGPGPYERARTEPRTGSERVTPRSDAQTRAPFEGLDAPRRAYVMHWLQEVLPARSAELRHANQAALPFASLSVEDWLQRLLEILIAALHGRSESIDTLQRAVIQATRFLPLRTAWARARVRSLASRATQSLRVGDEPQSLQAYGALARMLCGLRPLPYEPILAEDALVGAAISAAHAHGVLRTVLREAPEARLALLSRQSLLRLTLALAPPQQRVAFRNWIAHWERQLEREGADREVRTKLRVAALRWATRTLPTPPSPGTPWQGPERSQFATNLPQDPGTLVALAVEGLLCWGIAGSPRDVLNWRSGGADWKGSASALWDAWHTVIRLAETHVQPSVRRFWSRRFGHLRQLEARGTVMDDEVLSRIAAWGGRTTGVASPAAAVAHKDEAPSLPVADRPLRKEAAPVATAGRLAGSDERERAWQVAARSDTASLGLLRTPTAGAVILHPYLGMFYSRLGLWRDEAFVSRQAQLRAVSLLHWLATGREVFREVDLVLEKTMLGVPLAMPLPEDLAPTKQEVELGEGLLNALIQHWKALGQTSVGGLRGSFLCRPGVLQNMDDHWALKVERRTWDILLAELPWGISVVKMPWLASPLYVQWL